MPPASGIPRLPTKQVLCFVTVFNSCSLTCCSASQTTGLNIILLDGTWNQAKHLHMRLDDLLAARGMPLVPKLRLTPVEKSQFVARKQSRVRLWPLGFLRHALTGPGGSPLHHRSRCAASRRTLYAAGSLASVLSSLCFFFLRWLLSLGSVLFTLRSSLFTDDRN